MLTSGATIQTFNSCLVPLLTVVRNAVRKNGRRLCQLRLLSRPGWHSRYKASFALLWQGINVDGVSSANDDVVAVDRGPKYKTWHKAGRGPEAKAYGSVQSI
jgi:hypothetical protein